MLIVEASELLVLKGSSVVVDVIAGIIVAIAAIASAVNYAS